VSLLTDALRLREGRRPPRGESGPSFPPFRGPRPDRWILGALVACVLSVLAWWKGGVALETIEMWAGVVPVKPTPNLLAVAPREESGGGGERVRAESAETQPPPETKPAGEVSRGLENTPPVAVAKLPVEKPAPERVAISEEGKKRGEILLADSLVKRVAEKTGQPAGAPLVPAADPVAAALPEGGLKSMKVELAEEELVTATPEEREKKRTEAVEEFLRVLKVQGVRLQGAESRILVDGAPIGLGEKVGSLGLVLESVEPQKIIFSDASGRKYPKSY